MINKINDDLLMRKMAGRRPAFKALKFRFESNKRE
jgi:hypothetical protein